MSSNPETAQVKPAKLRGENVMVMRTDAQGRKWPMWVSKTLEEISTETKIPVDMSA